MLGYSVPCECGAIVPVELGAASVCCPDCFRRYALTFTVAARPFHRCANERCGAWFVQGDPRQRYCSEACSTRVRVRRHYAKATASR